MYREDTNSDSDKDKDILTLTMDDQIGVYKTTQRGVQTCGERITDALVIICANISSKQDQGPTN